MPEAGEHRLLAVGEQRQEAVDVVGRGGRVEGAGEHQHGMVGARGRGEVFRGVVIDAVADQVTVPFVTVVATGDRRHHRRAPEDGLLRGHEQVGEERFTYGLVSLADVFVEGRRGLPRGVVGRREEQVPHLREVHHLELGSLELVDAGEGNPSHHHRPNLAIRELAVLLLREALEVSVANTAVALELSAANVRVIHHRAMQRLRTRPPVSDQGAQQAVDAFVAWVGQHEVRSVGSLVEALGGHAAPLGGPSEEADRAWAWVVCAVAA